MPQRQQSFSAQIQRVAEALHLLAAQAHEMTPSVREELERVLEQHLNRVRHARRPEDPA